MRDPAQGNSGSAECAAQDKGTGRLSQDWDERPVSLSQSAPYLANRGFRQFALVNGTVALYRSADLDTIDAPSLQRLRSLGIADIHDLRKPDERRLPDLLQSSDIRLHTLSDHVHGNSGHRPNGRAKDIKGAYGSPGERMLHTYRKMGGQGRTLLEAIKPLLLATRPALVLCSHGKDRTGVVCASVLRAQGRPMGAIQEDYLRTNDYNRSQNDADLKRMSAEMGEEELAVMAAMFEARIEYLDAFWASIDAHFGSFKAFLTG